MQLSGAILIFAFVLVITYFTSKWVGGYQKISMQNKNLQIMESIKVGTNKFICLVKAGKVYLVVAVGKDEVTMLAQLTEEQLTDFPVFDSVEKDGITGKMMTADSFQEVLEKVRQHFQKK